jgi:hypothetical protein
MNERIHKLVRQCGGYHIDDDGEEGKAAVLIGKDVEEFAKLLVQECAEIARLNTRVDSKVYLMIQEHFGVEQ